jgi:hypothetical protein
MASRPARRAVESTPSIDVPAVFWTWTKMQRARPNGETIIRAALAGVRLRGAIAAGRRPCERRRRQRRGSPRGTRRALAKQRIARIERVACVAPTSCAPISPDTDRRSPASASPCIRWRSTHESAPA